MLHSPRPFHKITVLIMNMLQWISAIQSCSHTMTKKLI
uniref:Uncharacterized protein n=1 Tax=Anguilla anguilla TaxID=7936 RepID=A0A0E9QTZ4_ANGAN